MTQDDQKFHDFVDRVNTPSPTDVAQTRATIQNTLAQITPAPHQRRIRPWQIGVLTAVAALFLLTLGGIFNPAMNEVFAKAPVVGQFFARFTDPDRLSVVVENNGGGQHVTGQSTVNGVTIKLDSAYLEGQTVGVTGTATSIKARKNEWFNLQLAKSAPASFEQTAMDVRAINQDTYRFSFFGQLDAVDSRKPVTLPITISRFVGHPGPWKFNLKLTPSRAVNTAIRGTAQLPYQTKLALTQYTRYSGGTALLTMNLTLADKDTDVSVLSIKAAADNEERLLNATAIYQNDTHDGQQNPIVGYRIKQLPKNTKQLNISGSVNDKKYNVTVPIQ